MLVCYSQQPRLLCPKPYQCSNSQGRQPAFDQIKSNQKQRLTKTFISESSATTGCPKMSTNYPGTLGSPTNTPPGSYRFRLTPSSRFPSPQNPSMPQGVCSGKSPLLNLKTFILQSVRKVVQDVSTEGHGLRPGFQPGFGLGMFQDSTSQGSCRQPMPRGNNICLVVHIQMFFSMIINFVFVSYERLFI